MFWATPPIALRFCVRCSYSFQMVAKPNFGKFIWHNFFSLPTIMIQASSTQHIESLCASLPIQHIEPQTSLQAHSLARRVYSPLSFKPTPQPVELDHFSLSSRSTPIFSKKRDNKKKKINPRIKPKNMCFSLDSSNRASLCFFSLNSAH